MIISRILAPVHSLGPDERIVLWVQGCKKRCIGCIAEDLQEKSGKSIGDDTLAMLLIRLSSIKNCKAITISGGDPFEQSVSLLTLLQTVRNVFDDILVYTGYTIEEIQNGCEGTNGVKCLDYIDVLIDGRYVDELNTSECVMRGSSNQKIHFLNKSLKQKYSEYMAKGRIIENFVLDDTTIVTGIVDREGKG